MKEEAFGMNKKVVIIALVLICSIATVTLGEWTVHLFRDPIMSRDVWYADSPLTYPLKQMSFPPSGATAFITIMFDGKNDSVTISFSSAPIIMNTRKENTYELFTTNVVWDNVLEQVQFYRFPGSTILFFDDQKYAITRMRNSRTMILELNWYLNGTVYFMFDLTGASDAINEIHAKFGK